MLDNRFFLFNSLFAHFRLIFDNTAKGSNENFSWFQGNMSKQPNHLKKIRESRMMSKAELARKADVSPITIGRIETGMPCRVETKRKIILALGFKLTDKDKIFNN